MAFLGVSPPLGVGSSPLASTGREAPRPLKDWARPLDLVLRCLDGSGHRLSGAGWHWWAGVGAVPSTFDSRLDSRVVAGAPLRPQSNCGVSVSSVSSLWRKSHDPIRRLDPLKDFLDFCGADACKAVSDRRNFDF